MSCLASTRISPATASKNTTSWSRSGSTWTSPHKKTPPWSSRGSKVPVRKHSLQSGMSIISLSKGTIETMIWSSCTSQPQAATTATTSMPSTASSSSSEKNSASTKKYSSTMKSSENTFPIGWMSAISAFKIKQSRIWISFTTRLSSFFKESTTS